MDWEQLGSEEKIEAAYRAATADMPPAYVEVLGLSDHRMQLS
jgi:hypothetical protein